MKTIVILLTASGLVLVAVKWAFFPWIPYRRLPRHQVRHLKLRLWLRHALGTVAAVRTYPATRRDYSTD